MKITITLLVLVLFFLQFLPTRVFADYSQELDACHKILSKSSPDEYCTLHINAEFEGSVGSSKLYIANAYIYPESGVGQATKSLEEKYKSRLKQWQAPGDSGILDSRERELYKKVIEEAGPDNMRFLIYQSPDEGFYTIGKNIVYDFRTYLYMQQGVCVIVMDGGAGRGYIKNRNNRYDDVDGDIEKLKKESIVYMNKVGSDLTKNCKKDTKAKTPSVKALIATPPKESDFKKVKPSDFEIVYPESTSSAIVKPATQSASITGSIFIGKVSGEGEIVIELPAGEKATLTDDNTAFEKKMPDWGRITFPGPQQIYIKEVDCSLRAQPSCSWVGDWARCANNYSLGFERVTGTCTYKHEDGPIRALVEQGEVAIKTTGDVSVSTQKADFGIGYDATSGQSIIEIYNGSVKILNKSGQSKNISTVYGSQINRIEVSKDGTMSEKIAIPGSEWEAFLASQQKKTESEPSGNVLPIIVIAVLGIGGIALLLHKKGKLQTMFQKVSGMTKRIKKDRQEEKTT